MKVGFKNFILLVQGCTLGSTGVDTDHELSNILSILTQVSEREVSKGGYGFLLTAYKPPFIFNYMDMTPFLSGNLPLSLMYMIE